MKKRKQLNILKILRKRGLVIEVLSTNNSIPSGIFNEYKISDTQSYVLNFHGRVTQASVKNFQIVHDADRTFSFNMIFC